MADMMSGSGGITSEWNSSSRHIRSYREALVGHVTGIGRMDVDQRILWPPSGWPQEWRILS